MRENAIATTCAIAGGGPAGVMLGLLLARAGIEVTVLEKHADFLRDFRGDTIHPSTLEVMHELGLLDALLARPHEKMREAGVGWRSRAPAICRIEHPSPRRRAISHRSSRVNCLYLCPIATP